jgi:type I restriction enzyme M protein
MEKIWYDDLSDIKVGKKSPLTLAHFDEFFRLLPARANSRCSWTVSRAEVEAKHDDLKAVNPDAKTDQDTRTPEELSALIESKGREVAQLLLALRTGSSSP